MNAQLRKAAILISALDRKAAETLLGQMPKDYAKRVLAAATELGKIDPNEQKAVMRDFLSRNGAKAPEAAAPANPDLAEVELALSEEAAQPAGRTVERAAPHAALQQPLVTARRFSFVAEDSIAPLASILQREQPRLAALILAHLRADLGAAVLSEMNPPSRLAIVERIADLEEAVPEVLDELEHELKNRLLRERLKLEGSPQGLAALSGILQASDPNLRSQISEAMGARRQEQTKPAAPEKMDDENDTDASPVLTANSEQEPATTAAVAPKITFSGLSALDDVSLAVVFGAVSPQVALLALVGADELLVGRILGVLPRREAANFRKRLEEVGPLRLKEVELAQTRLSHAAEELLQNRRITLPIHDRARMAA